MGLLNFLWEQEEEQAQDWIVVADSAATEEEHKEERARRVSLELFPRQGDYGETKVANSIQELDESKTWVIIHCGGDALAWSPCDEESFVVPYDVAFKGEGLVIAPGCAHDIQGPGQKALVDYEEEAVYVIESPDRRADENFWIYSSLTDQWELVDRSGEQKEYVFDEEEGTELGKLYFYGYTTWSRRSFYNCNPKLKVAKQFPSLGRNTELIGLHWYKGVLYGFGNNEDDLTLRLFKWGAWWEQVDSCPVYQHGHTFAGDKNMFELSAGGRYICVLNWVYQSAEFGYYFMLVYDLENKRWHYHTVKNPGDDAQATVIVCNRGSHRNKIMDALYKSIWKHEAELKQSLLPIPPVPSLPTD